LWAEEKGCKIMGQETIFEEEEHVKLSGSEEN
jgi:hypothetical protein